MRAFSPGCFEKKNAWSSSGVIHLDNLKELAKKFRLHKSIPNFFRDYTTEDSLVAVLKRYVRNNAAFLSLAPVSVARARRSGGNHPQTDPAVGVVDAVSAGGTGGDSGGCGSDPPHVAGHTSSMDSASLLDGGASLGSGGMTNGMNDDANSAQPTKTTISGDSELRNPQHRTASGSFAGILSNDALHPSGAAAGGASAGQVSKASGHNSSTAALGAPHATGNLRGRRLSESSAPNRPLKPKRPTKASGTKTAGCFGLGEGRRIVTLPHITMQPAGNLAACVAASVDFLATILLERNTAGADVVIL